jgi:hypothetical protein
VAGESWGHLAGRFFGALRPGGPSPEDGAWVETILEPAEYALWARQPGHDRRHSAGVARQVESALAGGPHAGDSRWPACALLHDIGKLASGLSVPHRVLATLAGRATGGAVADPGAGGCPPDKGAVRRQRWQECRGLRRRIALYLRHPELGADMIRMAGGRDEVAHWAGAHHDRARLDPTLMPAPVVAALVAADND